MASALENLLMNGATQPSNPMAELLSRVWNNQIPGGAFPQLASGYFRPESYQFSEPEDVAPPQGESIGAEMKRYIERRRNNRALDRGLYGIDRVITPGEEVPDLNMPWRPLRAI